MKKSVGQILTEKGWATEADIKKALDFQNANQCKIGEAMVKLGLCS